MSRTFKTVDYDQALDLTVRLGDCLPPEHLARFVVDSVAQLDLAALYARYGTRGGEPYAPEVLLGLLLYGYATGVFSSRKIERATYEAVPFRRRLSAFLSAADSVTEIMWRQGMRYARQKGKGAVFEKWFDGKQDLFRTPEESKPKQGKYQGTDAVWVYLRAARHETIHIQQISLNEGRRFDIAMRFRLIDNSVEFEFKQDDNTFQRIKPVPGLPVLAGMNRGEKIWTFRPLTIETYGKAQTLDPPNEDIVTVCRNHIKKLESLTEECKAVLK